MGMFWLLYCCLAALIAIAAGDTTDPAAEDAYEIALGLVFFLWFSALVLYFVILEAVAGQTLGKKLVGIRVVRVDGSPIGFTESFIRNLLRIVDGLFGYLVGAIFIWTSDKQQRLGDRAAGTIVIWVRQSNQSLDSGSISSGSHF